MPISLPIYSESYRPSSDWVKVVSENQRVLEELLPLKPSLQDKITRQILIKQIVNNLHLSYGELAIDQDKIIQVIDSRGHLFEKDQVDPLTTKVNNFFNSLQFVKTLVHEHKDKPGFIFTSKLLKELHGLAFSNIDQRAGFYRTSQGQPLNPTHKVADADFIEVLLDNALDWFNTDSFRELHPLEQAWLVHLRIIDLQPFEIGNELLARLIASFYAERANLCPIIISVKEKDFYSYAIDNSLMMITQPGVELFARSVIETYKEIFSAIENNSDT
jgi:Fic family protein